MLGSEKSSELGCDTGDLTCLCTKNDFYYGLRDCSSAICGSSDAAKVVAYGIQICKSAGVAISTVISSGSGTATGTATVSCPLEPPHFTP